jgi:phage terminase large subunit-like protein
MMADTVVELKLERLKRLKELKDELRQIESDEKNLGHRRWADIARPEQLPPDGNWFVWLILAGRGWGKSRTAAEWSAEKARRYPGARIALVARTIGDARDTMVEGDSGLLTCFRKEELRGGSEDGAWNRSMGELYLDNGSRFKTFTSEKPWRLRGPQFNFAWGDESCFWNDAFKGTVTDTTWSNLTIATRLPKKSYWDDDYRTQIVVATTPRPVPLLKVIDPDPARAGLMQRETTIITRGRTVDNLSNLSESYKVNVIAPLLGTRLGRQELDAELLEDNDAALWRRDWIEETRIAPNGVPDLVRVVIGVDPAVTDGESSAQTGIVVAGAARTGHGYILADFTMRGTPKEVMSRIVEAYHEFKADRVVAEVNNGGDYIGTLLHTVDQNVPFRAVRATRGKHTRAEPISSLYEQRRIHHAGVFPYLEDELCQWTPMDPVSPDRLDACVWACTDLRDLITASFLDAYGVTRCENCGNVFLATENGQPRLACPSCRMPLGLDQELETV